MAKTFEALLKSEKEKKSSLEKARAFYLQPRRKHPRVTPSAKPVPCVAEEYRRMKHRLRRASSRDKVKVIQFCSAGQGEGTSTAVINFAVTLAAEGDSVLLVDANLRSPTFHDSFGLERSQGLTDVLLEEKQPRDVIKNSGIANLSIVTSGALDENSAALLESRALSLVLDQMKALADWVLMDSSPVTLFHDAAVLAGAVDGVVMIVQADKTRWEVAQRAKKRLEDCRGDLLGVVLNRRKLYIPDWVYRML